MLVVSGTDEGLTSSAKGSRTFEGHSGWSWVVGERGEKQPRFFCPCSCWHPGAPQQRFKAGDFPALFLCAKFLAFCQLEQQKISPNLLPPESTVPRE